MKIGIRREDKNQWEARVPLIPEHVKDLTEYADLKFVVQPSPIRAFSEEEYEQAGAQISEDLSDCPVVVAVKEIPIDFFIPEHAYVFFSHTIKGQEYNMPMLKQLMANKNTLIDYERILDDQGRRLVFFGRFAGIAGMIDTLWALGKRLEWEGHSSPFSICKQALGYVNLDAVKRHYSQLASTILEEKVDFDDKPVVFGFAGYGNVSRGAQEMFDLLPHVDIYPEGLQELFASQHYDKNVIYKVVFKEEHLVRPRSPEKEFELAEYYEHPERYASRFEEYLPYLTVLVNAIYWDERYPRLVTKEYLKKAYTESGQQQLRVIGDVTCDTEGSIECNVESTDSGNPVYVYDPLSGTHTYGVAGNGPVVLAVDNLPCELPRESSAVFSDVLKGLMIPLSKADFRVPFEQLDLPPELKRAVILRRGELTPDYRYMQEYVENL